MSKIPHFFKSKSRIGLTNKPLNQKDWNFGVEDAPDAILTPQFLKIFGNYKLNEFTFPNPEDIDPKDYLSVLRVNLTAYKDLINKNLGVGETQIVIGGDNSITFSSLLALQERMDVSKLGIIHFDSHGDINSFNVSPSKNFHGMYLRPFLDNFDIPQINNLVPSKLKSSQALFIGDLKLDEEESEYFKIHMLENINRSDYLENKEAVISKIKAFLEEYEHIHINFDIDIFDQNIAGATGIPGDGRWGSEVFEILKFISTHPSASLDLAEVNPKKEGAEKTIKLARQILKTILGL